MNKKHLIQLAATAGAVLVLYVLSYAPALQYSYWSGKNSAFATQLYRPVAWLWNNSKQFDAAYKPYNTFWSHVFEDNEAGS
jgi:hypothetical protein